MAQQNPMDRQAEFERIAARRKAMLEAEDELRRKHAAEKEEFASRGKAAFAEEVSAARQRSEEREEWRQDQHVKKAEEKKEKQRLEEEQKSEELKKEEHEKFLAKQKEDTDILHATTVKKKLAERKKSIDKEGLDADKKARDIADREGRVADEELQRQLVTIERDARKKQQQFDALIERRRKMLEESYVHAKQMLLREEAHAVGQQKNAVGQQRMQLESEHKKQLMLLDKEVETNAVKAKQERAALEREAKEASAEKHGKINLDQSRRVRESLQRHDSAIEWIGLFDPEKEGK